MKRFLLIMIVGLLFSGLNFGQISGTYTIPGAPYATIAAAISAINTSGIGAGGVTFNVTPGYTETFATPTAGLITATGTAANQIIFKKNGAGANPIVTAATGTGTYDYIFCIGGGDYITFDGINIQDNSANVTTATQMEYGFAIFKASATNGSQYNTIINGTIAMSNNGAGYGIYSHNWAYTAPGTALTITDIAGANSYNKYFGLTFNVYNGVYLYGYADVAPFAYYDQGNEVGKDGANTFNGLANGGTTVECYGFYAYYQNGMKLANNTFTGTVPQTTGSCYVFYLLTGSNSNVDVYGNTISLTYNGTGSFYGIYNSGMGNTGTSNAVNYYNNTITNTSLPNHTSGTVYFIYISTGGVTANFYNNNVSNNTVGSATATSTGALYYIYFASSPTTPGTTNMYNNTISNNSRTQSVLGGGTTYILYNGGSGNVFNEYGNVVNNITINTNTTVYGIYNLFTGTTKNVYNNTFTNIYNINSTIYSLYNGNGSGSAYYYNNKFQNINTTSGTGALYGVYQSSGINVYFYNNYFGEFKAPTSANAIYGMYLSGGSILGAYNNTIYLNSVSSGANFSVIGIYASTTPIVELRNNIVVNASTPMGTGRAVVYQRSSTSLATYTGISNNNNFWCGTPGASNLIYYDGTNSDQTLAAFQARVSPRDGQTVTENSPFVNVTTSPYDLHMKTTVASQCESGGATVTTPMAVTTDYDNNPRFPNPGYPVGASTPSAPDIGADEFGGIFIDLTPPNMQFTPFMNTSLTTARTLTATITDATGVPTSGLGLPRLYWRINTGTWNSLAGTWVSGSTYTFTFGAGAVLNDVIFYYMVAQDLVIPTPNIGANPSGGASGFTTSPPACSTPPTTPYSYIIVGQMCGNYNVGVGQTYTTLTAAVADLNLKELICAVTLTLTDATYGASETFPITITNPAGLSATNTITIKPAVGVTPVISGASASAILKLNQASYVTINGSNSGGTDRSLTITNTTASGTTAAIWVGSNGIGLGSSNVTIKNCNLACGYNQTVTSCGIFAGASSAIPTSGDDNDNLTIQNNTITNSSYGVYIISSTLGLDDNLLITKNTIGSATVAQSVGYRGVYINGANAPMVSGNEVFNMVTVNTWSIAGINFYANVPNGVIAGNKIHDMQSNGSGWGGCYGISIGYGSATVTNAQIINNVIYMLTTTQYSISSTLYNPFGIWLYSGTGHKIYHNSINMNGTQSNVYGTAGSLAACVLYYSSGVTGTDVRDNIFASNLIGLAGTQSFCIYAPSGTTFANINYNDYWPSGTYGVLGFLGSNRTTLAAWQTATGQDVNSINIDPLFTSGTNLLPTTTGMSNAGTYFTAVPTDFAGTMRSNPPDMGAYEFAVDPLVNTTAATALAMNSATLNGTVNASNFTTNTFFDYGLTTAYGTSLAATPASVSGSTTTPISLGITGLTPTTLYHYRARVVTTGGLIAYGPDMTFTTTVAPPTMVTTAATGIATTGATLNGTANANGSTATVTFQYGLTVAYGSTVNGVPYTVTGISAAAVNAPVSGLSPNTLYHYRIVGVNSGGTSYGNDMTFTTLAIPPAVVTNAASGIGVSTATLNGTVTANNANTTVSFEWGLTVAYGSNVAATPGTVTGNTATPVQATIGGLVAGNTYHFRCVAVNSGGTTYGTDQSFVAGCTMPSAAGAISGPAAVCANSTGNVYTVGTIANATGYTWTVPAGATITAGANTNSITVTFGTASGNITVVGSNGCGNGASSSIAVTVNPLPTPTITGSASVCQGTSNVYTTQTGMSAYTWTVTAGGTITAGAGTSSITVQWTTAGAKTITVTYTNVNGCSAITPGSYAVTVNTAPAPTITGQNSLCVNSGYYNYTTETGFTNYTWTISAGGTITYGQGSNSVQVTWNQSGTQWIAVNYSNANGCSAATPVQLAVTVNPLPGAVGTITGTAAICSPAQGVAYSVAAVPNATTYVWTLPAGATIATGTGTNSITVNYGTNAVSGNITVYGNNLCGNGSASPPLTVTITASAAAAGTITGQAAVCQGTTGVIYTVPVIANATSYTWTVPTGSTIVSGNNTNSITVDFGMSAVSGNVTVYGSNSCGNGTVSPTFAVTVSPIPTTPVITENGDLLTSSATNGNQWYFEGAAIPGATAQTYTATQSGNYWVVVTLNGCSSAQSNQINVVMTGIEPILSAGFSVYPVPNDGRFTISIATPSTEKISILVYNNLGAKVYELNDVEVSGKLNKVIDLRPAAPGVYSIVFVTANGNVVKRTIVK
jgi:hypothetical protein